MPPEQQSQHSSTQIAPDLNLFLTLVRHNRQIWQLL